MRWQLGSDEVTESLRLMAYKPGHPHAPMTVAVDNYDDRKAHTTVVFNDRVQVSDVTELDDTSGMCSFTIESDHGVLMVILPVTLETFIVNVAAAHREYLDDTQLRVVPDAG